MSENQQISILVAGIVAFFTVLVGGIFVLADWSISKQCHSVYEAAGWKVQYGYWTGCLVDRGNGKLIPAGMLREVVD